LLHFIREKDYNGEGDIYTRAEMAKGHTPRNFSQRYAKWTAKYTAFSNPTVASTILTNVASIAESNYQQQASFMSGVNQQIATVLNEYGVTGPTRVIYQGYGMKVGRALNRLGSGQALSNMIAGLKAYYLSAFNANPQILDAVTNILTGSPNGYVS